MKVKWSWFEAAIVTAPFLTLAIFWQQLPARVPVHWNLHGVIDGRAPKSWIWVAPFTGLALVALLHALPRVDPKLRAALQEDNRMQSILPIIRVALAGLFAAITALQLAAALGHGILAGRLLPTLLLLLFAVLGNYLGNLRQNYVIGIRTPWTLKSAETWRATHRLGGRLMFFGALSLLVLQFFLSDALVAFLFVGMLVALVLWSLFYSWRHFARTRWRVDQSFR